MKIASQLIGCLPFWRVFDSTVLMKFWVIGSRFFDVVENAIRRACETHKVEYRSSDALEIYNAIPTWQPHPCVVETLQGISAHIPLVILSNSMVDLIPHSVKHLKAPFHAVYTAEEAQAYKPRGQAFEYMFGQPGCGPDRMLHVSSSFRDDLMMAHDLGFMANAFIDRNHEYFCDGYKVNRLMNFGQLDDLVGVDLPSHSVQMERGG
jgi:2-haloacid dehalogenase